MYPKETPASYGMRLLHSLQSQSKYLFSHAEALAIAETKGIPKAQLNIVLSNLTKLKRIIRLRRGLYAGLGSLPGQMQAHPFAIATRLVEPSAISHWSALQYHGLTEQVPQIITASTSKKVYTPSMRNNQTVDKHGWDIDGVRYEYTQIKSAHFFGIEQVWVDERFRVSITDKERTILDLFVFQQIFGGFGEVLGILEQMLPVLKVLTLVEYAVRYNQKSLCKRLGWALEHFGISGDLLAPLLEVPIKNYCQLDSGSTSTGSYNKRWMVVENLKI